MGQAGLLDISTVPERYRKDALSEGYFTRLRNEYLYLANKFTLHHIDAGLWRFLRLRPQNFPHIRISQLANLYYEQKTSLAALTDCDTLKKARSLMSTHVTPYWETHYTFGNPGPKNAKNLSASSLNLLLINTVIPMLFAYGRHKSDGQAVRPCL